MGSWNETCMLSNLPITPGDKVVWLLIAESPYESREGCYHNDFYHIRSVPIYGSYGDYGRIEISNDQELSIEVIRDQFVKDLIPKTANERDKLCGIPAVAIENFSFKTLQVWLHEGHLYVDAEYLHRESNKRMNLRMPDGIDGEHWPEDVPTHPQRIHKVMILRDVWDSMMELELPGFFRQKLNVKRFKLGAEELVTELLTETEEDKELAKSSLSADRVLWHKMMRLVKQDSHNLFVSAYIGPSGMGGQPAYGMHNKYIVETLIKRLMEGQVEASDIRPIFKSLAELAFIEAVLANARMSWHPTTGTGSQGQEWLLTMEMHLRMAKAAEKHYRAYREWLGEDSIEIENLKNRLNS